jgi:hypothetical protein
MIYLSTSDLYDICSFGLDTMHGMLIDRVLPIMLYNVGMIDLSLDPAITILHPTDKEVAVKDEEALNDKLKTGLDIETEKVQEAAGDLVNFVIEAYELLRKYNLGKVNDMIPVNPEPANVKLTDNSVIEEAINECSANTEDPDTLSKDVSKGEMGNPTN